MDVPFIYFIAQKAYDAIQEIAMKKKISRREFMKSSAKAGLLIGLAGSSFLRGSTNDPFDVVVLASLRMVADLADADKVMAVLPGGVSGRLFDKHGKDQIEPFIDGSKVYWWFSDAAIEAHRRHTLVLRP